MPNRTEEDLAARVVAWLQARSWEVYQEVDCRLGRADIVAVRGPLIHVIECKLAFGFPVLEQARRWLGHANLVSVATESRSGRRDVCDIACEALGVGRLLVGHDVVEAVSARMLRRVSRTIRNTLRPEHQTYAKAGTNGGYYSAWRGTCARLVEIVVAANRHGLGISPKDAIAKIAHHYATDSSARSCLLREVRDGKVPGIIAEERPHGGGWRFLPSPAPSGGGSP